ncbi:hypothetical protein MB901379_01584 [Mycobacterium basiliense]|uniref:Uncharacterized protein n=1 Tax=Mycobacterium basiliense TaxID=2094119 RepID=A0A3S4BD96_9MYCO|nr:hypothetical protein MB901379_01584 [Mycobacterium basiliense]
MTCRTVVEAMNKSGFAWADKFRAVGSLPAAAAPRACGACQPFATLSGAAGVAEAAVAGRSEGVTP